VSCFGNFFIFSQKNWEIFEKMDFFSPNSINFAKSLFKKLKKFSLLKNWAKEREKKPLVHDIFTNFKASLSRKVSSLK